MNKKYMKERLRSCLKDEKQVTMICRILEDYERHENLNKRKCQEEGIQKAKERGVSFGRPRLQVPENFEIIYMQYLNKEITAVAAAKMCSMALSTFYRRVQEMENKKSYIDRR